MRVTRFLSAPAQEVLSVRLDSTVASVIVLLGSTSAPPARRGQDAQSDPKTRRFSENVTKHSTCLSLTRVFRCYGNARERDAELRLGTGF